mgnify:FL=1
MINVKLVEQARNKDEEAYAKLIDLTSKKLYYTVCAYVNDKDEAKNIVQDVYRNCFGKMYQLKDDSKFESWIMVSVANKCRDYLRKNHKYDEVVVSDLNEEELDFEGNIEDERMEFKPDANFNYQELKEGLQGVLDELPEVQKMSIILVHLDGLKVKEAAAALQVPEGTVKSSISIGKQKIKNKIEELRKQNKSFYAVAPMPFLVWMLKEEMEKTSVPAFVVHASTIQPPKIPKEKAAEKVSSTATKKTIATTATKTAATTATKAGVGKMIIGAVVASAVGFGTVFGGHAVIDKIENRNNASLNEKSSLIEATDYKILDTDVPNFEKSPFEVHSEDVDGYAVMENGLYGVIDTNGKYIMKPKYKYGVMTPYQDSDNVCMFSEDNYSSGESLDEVLGSNRGGCSYGSIGVPAYSLTFNEVENKPYVIKRHYDTGENELITYDWKTEFNYSMLVYPNAQRESKQYYIVLYDVDRVIGPYDEDEVATFRINGYSQDKEGKMSIYGMLYPIIDGLIYEKVNDGYVIWDAKGSKHTDIVFNKAEVISNNTMKVEKDGRMGIVDENLNLVLFGDFEDVSRPIDGKAYVKIKGEWKQIQLLEN